MTSNVDLKVQQIQQDFQALIAYVTGPETRTATAYTVDFMQCSSSDDDP